MVVSARTNDTTANEVWVIGAGLAGCEVALQLARREIAVRLFEMKPTLRTAAQTSDDYAELVCSNSFRAADLENAVGVIKEEMRRAGGALIEFADMHAVPAGGALAVDRQRFSQAVTQAVRTHPFIDVVEGEVVRLPEPGEVEDVVVATGPLTSAALADDIARVAGQSTSLYFYDSIAPIVAAESIDLSVAFRASRYGKGEGDDYVNCPLSQPEYERFLEGVMGAEKVVPRAFEAPKYFEGCLPLEVVAERGPDTLRFGCMKPVGLADPRTGQVPYAVVQLRAENRDRTAYNLVGFQTRMKWGEQARVFRMIPGLEDAEFLRFGSVHRNTYLDSPLLLDAEFRLKAQRNISFAGQITGVEGYVESMASGFLVGRMIAARRRGASLPRPPKTTTLGALLTHVLGEDRTPGAVKQGHVPSNIHWGHCPPLGRRASKRDRRRLMADRALEDLGRWLEAVRDVG
ncbi:MAG: methylenetetrahydrofolate--tRNA-(uracil(54)-C(5))-methyltransferase (FADH(2)-oxidizing) TrmFO [Deltaproteobacteria bacterium]|nr:methylenetetrahydrofolate--tRNA-(uracil(54)-C(5))-methyltransferase (FADH(2)-oxidizing) TrmFO [Deltaproteobacteria bacterium]